MQRHIHENNKQKTDQKRFENFTKTNKFQQLENQYNQLSEKTQKMVGKFKHWASEILSWAPFVSLIKRSYEGIKGEDAMTQRPLTKTEILTRLSSSGAALMGHISYMSYPYHQEEIYLLAYPLFTSIIANGIHAWENYKFHDHLFENKENKKQKGKKEEAIKQENLPQKSPQGAIIKTFRDYQENYIKHG